MITNFCTSHIMVKFKISEVLSFTRNFIIIIIIIIIIACVVAAFLFCVDVFFVHVLLPEVIGLCCFCNSAIFAEY